MHIRVAAIGTLVALLGPGPAAAWAPEQAAAIELPAPPHGVEVVPTGSDRPGVLVLGAQVSWLVDPFRPDDVQTLPIGGRDAQLLDVTGDGRDELLFCGPQGLKAVPWEGTWGGRAFRLLTTSCEALAVVDSPEGPLVAVAGDDLSLWQIPGDGTLVLHERLDLPWQDDLVLAAEGELLAIGSTGRPEIVEWSPHGRSTLATGGPIGGLALGPWGWAWTLPERGLLADMTHRTEILDAGPGRLDAGDLDSDAQRDLAVIHPDAGQLTVLRGDGERQVLEAPGRPVDVAIADVQADGCDDIVVASRAPAQVVVYRTTSCGTDRPLALPGPGTKPPSTSPEPSTDGVAGLDPDERNRRQTPDLSGAYRRPPPTQRPPRVLGLEVPWFLGDKSARPAERLPLQQYVVVGSGWAMGGALRNVVLQIPFFPALSVEMEWGGPHLRWFIGGDSAALFLWMVDDGQGGIHLANLSTGPTFGSPRLRTGPFATGGLLNVGAGWRTVFTPWDDGDTFKGIEVRLTWFYPATGEVMVLYVWSQPMKKPGARAARRPPPRSTPTIPPPPPAEGADEQSGEQVARAEPVPDREPIRRAGRDDAPRKAPSFLACRRFGIAVGAAAGGSSTRYSWEYVGSDVPISPSGSPAVALQCETGGKVVGLLLGAETAPFYSYLTRDDQRLHHMGSHTLGIMLGGDAFRVGPTATAGVWTLGGGLRAAIKLREDDQGLLHQLDVRATAHWPSAPAGQLMVLYGISFDPWK